ncbi:MAG: response regulator transcription factor [Proteiniphilum sp.]
MKPIEIIICDDHPLIAEGLLSFVEQQPLMEIKAIATSASGLMETLETVSADILLLDINLPDESGLDLCLKIRKEYPEMKILALSNLNQRSIILRMLHHGASGYLLKSAPTKEIEQAIYQIHEGGVYFGKETQRILSSFTDKELNEVPSVTRREKEVLSYLAEGLTTPEIARKMYISTLTVDSHRKSLMKKFDSNKTVNLVQKAKEAGVI